MIFKSKENLLICMAGNETYYKLGKSVGKLDQTQAAALNNKYKNKHLVLIDNYQLNLIDVPNGTLINTAKQIISFKLREYIDYPVSDCSYDILETEPSLAKYFTASVSKTKLKEKFAQAGISNFKTIDVFENTLRNIGIGLVGTEKASLIVYTLGNYTYILLLYKKNILNYRRLEIGSSDFDFWISEIQRSSDIFERQYRFTGIDETVIVNLEESKHSDASILLKNVVFKTIEVAESIPSDICLALRGLECRL